QMTYGLRIIQGRSAEMLGDRAKPGRRETTVENDRRMRTFGWARAAARTAPSLDAGTLALLRAYCEGVNDSFAEQRAEGRLHPEFARLGVETEPWTPADCLLSWWHLAQFFATDGTRDLMSLRNQRQPPREMPPRHDRRWVDDDVAVVQRSEVSADWLERLRRGAAEHGFTAEEGAAKGEVEGPKFSHAWVVDGRRSGTGSAVLVSDPQTPVRNPSLWMEFHVRGRTLDVRGVGVPGSPALLIGFNRYVAWGVTALGADQADLFLLETEASRTNQYRWNGEWRPMTVREERIRVKGGSDVVLTVRETHVGPVVSEFSFRQGNDPEVALKRIPWCDPERDTVQAAFEMMRATHSPSFLSATAGWRFPSANCVYGDAQGRIGYTVLAGIPIRARGASDRDGSTAQPGQGDASDWIGFVPPELLPRVQDPPSGYLLSANHRPVASFYPFPLGISTGSLGDTLRSWRLRERLSAGVALTPSEVLAIHQDTVNPARRDLVRLGLWLRETSPDRLSAEARQALEVLEPWWKAGASSDLRSPGSDLATRLSTFFRFVSTPLAREFGGGESGLSRFLKDAVRRTEAKPPKALSEDAVVFVDRTLAEAWRGQAGRDARAGASKPAPLGWMDTLDGLGSLDSRLDLAVPGITCLDGQTLHSQAAQSYTQWVPLHDVDSARSLCPVGHSDRPDGKWRTSTMELWGTGELHAAPLGRTAVERLTVSRRSW
ncbi:MAG: penicillin acylase family protein, partial [Verrucomicrobiales bacterium]|nr:penicillin acylase family protein [Verrucomicrobiales bacterium]